MAVAYGGTGSINSGTTSVAPTLPATVNAGDLLWIGCVSKYPANPPSTPDGWRAISNSTKTGGAGASGQDTGDVLVTVFVREADGTETPGAAVNITVTGGNAVRAICGRFTKTSTKGWSYACAGGADNVAGTTWSATMDTDPGLTAGDFVMSFTGTNTDASTFTLQALTATGVTMGTETERGDSGTSNGDDLSLLYMSHAVSSGTSIAAPVFAATSASVASAGATVILRAREVDTEYVGGGTLGALTDSAAGTVETHGASAVTLDTIALVAEGTVEDSEPLDPPTGGAGVSKLGNWSGWSGWETWN
jgi:hypothetical protein